MLGQLTLSATAKKRLHALIAAAASGGLSWVAFTLPTVVHVPAGLRGVLVGVAVAAISKMAGYGLGELVQTTGEGPKP